ncbi:hypothetical protein [Nocardia transvalensis]|uniref:hypothetical protein n=1 Tax=Nocardia transvalensis TaxID=37333 RepID=UPI0018955D86|nr:hypothetical protein [Nocardia transvalensis]MBF6333456.1 hypothetical protein [Nocardia transvalensis]
MTCARQPWTKLRRRVLEALNDGKEHWPDELYKSLGLSRRNGVVLTLTWFHRHGYVEHKRAPDGTSEYVVVGENKTDYIYLLTEKGGAAAGNLDAGYDVLNP